MERIYLPRDRQFTTDQQRCLKSRFTFQLDNLINKEGEKVETLKSNKHLKQRDFPPARFQYYFSLLFHSHFPSKLHLGIVRSFPNIYIIFTNLN